jgi:type I restriction enzyme R subunit
MSTLLSYFPRTQKSNSPNPIIMHSENAPPFFDPASDIDTTRHLLPHWQQGDAWIFVTWRLADSLPASLLEQLRKERKDWLTHHPRPWDEKTELEYHKRFSHQINQWLDQGMGACVLQDPAIAEIVADALHHFDGQRYVLAAFVVMPNHVHVLFRPLDNYTLPGIVKSWKGFTAREINRRLGKTGKLWQPEYWDRLIRNERHFLTVLNYILENPAKAGMTTGAWTFMSASLF